MPRPDARLDPGLQQRLLEQMREQQAARKRSRALRRYVALPLTLCLVAGSVAMSLDDDLTTAILGNLLATSLLWYLWKIRKHVASAFGFR